MFRKQLILPGKRGIGMLLSGAILLCSHWQATQAADETVLSKPPITKYKERAALNLARAYLGASIRIVDGPDMKEIDPGVMADDPNQSAYSLISADETIGCPLHSNKLRMIVTLPRPELLSAMEFSSYAASGDLDVWVSSVSIPANDKRWRQVVRSKGFAADKVFRTRFGSVDASYVMIEYTPITPGRLCALGLFGETKIDDVTVRAREHPITDQPPLPEVINYNYANLTSGGKVAYASSRKGNAEASQMIDDMPKTHYAFASDDASPTAVLELESVRPIRRVAVTFEAEEPGILSYYALTGLPNDDSVEIKTARAENSSEWIKASMPVVAAIQNGLPEIIKLKPKFFEDHQPDGTAETLAGRNRIAFDCVARDVRFILIRWTPKDGSACNYMISEVNVFGNTRERDVDVAWKEPLPPGEGAPIDIIRPLPIPSINSITPPDLPVVSVR